MCDTIQRIKYKQWCSLQVETSMKVLTIEERKRKEREECGGRKEREKGEAGGEEEGNGRGKEGKRERG